MTADIVKTEQEHIEHTAIEGPVRVKPASRLTSKYARSGTCEGIFKGKFASFLFLFVAFGCSMTQGFDSNTFGGLLAIDSFKKQFDLETPNATALATAML